MGLFLAIPPRQFTSTQTRWAIAHLARVSCVATDDSEDIEWTFEQTVTFPAVDVVVVVAIVRKENQWKSGPRPLT